MTYKKCYQETLEGVKESLNWYRKETSRTHIELAYPKPKLIIDFHRLSKDLRKEFSDLVIYPNSTLVSKDEFVLECSL